MSESQKIALQNIRPGGSGAARRKKSLNFSGRKGIPQKFEMADGSASFTGLGHGFGLEIHEQPRIARTHFKTGQVLTVEPGLYFPGIGGVRIEDDGVVTDEGFKVLSKFGKRLEV